MRRSIAVLSTDTATLHGLKAVLSAFGISQVSCHSCQEAMELATNGGFPALIVGFHLPGAQEVVNMAALLQPPQKPVLLALPPPTWPRPEQTFPPPPDHLLDKP